MKIAFLLFLAVALAGQWVSAQDASEPINDFERRVAQFRSSARDTASLDSLVEYLSGLKPEKFGSGIDGEIAYISKMADVMVFVVGAFGRQGTARKELALKIDALFSLLQREVERLRIPNYVGGGVTNRVSVPGSIYYPAGTPPDQIKDPATRAEYLRKISENEEKAKRNLLQDLIIGNHNKFDIYLTGFYEGLPSEWEIKPRRWGKQ